jgi:hypothetical protein
LAGHTSYIVVALCAERRIEQQHLQAGDLNARVKPSSTPPSVQDTTSQPLVEPLQRANLMATGQHLAEHQKTTKPVDIEHRRAEHHEAVKLAHSAQHFLEPHERVKLVEADTSRAEHHEAAKQAHSAQHFAEPRVL